jgi:hypothetical protein
LALMSLFWESALMPVSYRNKNNGKNKHTIMHKQQFKSPHISLNTAKLKK